MGKLLKTQYHSLTPILLLLGDLLCKVYTPTLPRNLPEYRLHHPVLARTAYITPNPTASRVLSIADTTLLSSVIHRIPSQHHMLILVGNGASLINSSSIIELYFSTLHISIILPISFLDPDFVTIHFPAFGELPTAYA